ncbi:MAG: transposase [Pseudomonadota bacterium]|nr:transposase [Pseudomonadota bacterium]
MARQARLVLAGQAHYVAQVGAGSARVFEDDADRLAYLAALLESSRSCGVAIHAYALAERRVELLATPRRGADLARFMQRLGRRYVAQFNRRHGRAGTLWSGRFGASAIETGPHVLDAMVAIEQLPVRESIGVDALEWTWSSARHHAGERADRLIEEHATYWRLGNTPFEREARYAAMLRAPVDALALERLLHAVRGGWPIGSTAFLKAHGDALGRALQPRPRGRPRAS